MSITPFDPSNMTLTDEEVQQIKDQDLMPPGDMIVAVTFSRVKPIKRTMKERVGNKETGVEFPFTEESGDVLDCAIGIICDGDLNDPDSMKGFSRSGIINNVILNWNQVVIDDLPSNIQGSHRRNYGDIVKIVTGLGLEPGDGNNYLTPFANDGIKGLKFRVNISHRKWNDRKFNNFSNFRPLS
jgi:hypothetical protein